MDELSGLAEKAVEFDRIGNISAAIHYYSVRNYYFLLNNFFNRK